MANPKDISTWQPWHFIEEAARLNEEDPTLPLSDAALVGAVLLAGLAYGPDDVDAIAGAISVDVEQIRHYYDNLVRGGVFEPETGKLSCNWFDEESGGAAFMLDQLVGLGLVRRAGVGT